MNQKELSRLLIRLGLKASVERSHVDWNFPDSWFKEGSSKELAAHHKPILPALLNRLEDCGWRHDEATDTYRRPGVGILWSHDIGLRVKYEGINK